MTLTVRYRRLDELPKRLRAPVIAHPRGLLEDRLGAVATLRESLLRGVLPAPSELEWPEPPLAETLLAALRRSEVVAMTRNAPDVTDEVVLTTLESLVTTERMLEAAEDHFVALAMAESAASSCQGPGCEGGGATGSIVLHPSALAKIRADARKLAVELACTKLGIELPSRVEHVRAACELRALLSKCAPRGFTLDRLPLRALAGSDAYAIREALRRLEQLAALMEDLGRRMQSPFRTQETIFESILGPLRRPIERVDESVRSFHPEVRAIERGDDLARMLASEAAMLTHPTLRLLWHARRTERSLLCYQAEGAGTSEVEETYGEGELPRRKPADRGPILVCLDVSGSMDGAPGQIAQALVLHLAMTAMADERPCHVFSFSGPGDVTEHDLSFDGEKGLEGLLTFLHLVFSGGTCLDEPLRRALAMHDETRWKNADVLLVTDGMFGPTQELIGRLERAKESSALRLHGVVIGRGVLGPCTQICTHVHRLADWLKKP